MTTAAGPPVPIRWTEIGTGIVVIDQTRLPEYFEEITLSTVDEIDEAIKMLRVRGAPLIGITAAMGIAALAAGAAAAGTPSAELPSLAHGWCDRLERSRPTAVNLTWAVDRMRRIVSAAGADLPGSLRGEADRIRTEDEAMCRRIGEHALTLLDGDFTALTHCNAGALATGGIGTALAPIYLAHAQGRRVRIFADETRPLLQGSRLTAWELGRAGVDVTVIADGTSAALMAHDPPDAVLVGADRIAANGDAANKIGTYGIAVQARHHGIPFYVLAPMTTIDLATPTGADIPIEFRSPDEVRRGFGRLTAPPDVAVWSPAFDVTPEELITAIITDSGVCRPPYRESLAAALAGSTA